MQKLEEIIEIPENITVSIADDMLSVKGPKGEVNKSFFAENINISTDSGKIYLKSNRNTKNERKIANSFKAHILNIFKGVSEGHHFEMKILSGHFPMTVTVNDGEFIVKNFFGEKTPRKFTLPKDVTVKVKGDKVDIESCDKELVGMVMSSIEKLTRRTNFDRRIFQDGIIVV
ncbi:50S ribosomal protein L6 [Candidatus Woesearchaeota archaeon]|nr:50S ribosomal protein L6 [Candidatus Woesearchaeota archaeon]|tara:strand:+ start:17211 stop:17729 length:519 start_codon:yes stop_codon:yes gene_type:complete